jgi:hypothetical protein
MGNDELAQDVPGRIDGLMTVKRTLSCRDFAIPFEISIGNFHDQDASIGSYAEAGLKGMQQTHPDLT